MAHNLFDTIQRAIALREPMSPPPIFEVLVGNDVKQAFLGRSIATLADDIAFWREAGYCLYPLNFGLFQFGGKATTVEAGQRSARGHYSVYQDGDVDIPWAPTGRGTIVTEEDFENYVWPAADAVNLTILDEAFLMLPDGMRVLANIGKIFTGAWQLMGFTTFAEALHDRPELVEKVLARVASIQCAMTARVIQHPAVGAVLHADDLACCSGPMVSPEIYRKFVFPAYKTLGDMCRERNILYLFHSDGRIGDLIPDILLCGFIGLHPIEPKPNDALEIKRQYGDRLCLLGHVDVDLLARGTPTQVREQTLGNLDLLARDGGYCPGSANSVPDYVPLENYMAMITAAKEWR